MKLGKDDARLLERCIEELEARTEAEVVLVLRPRSGHYRDVSYLVGAAAAFLLLAFFLYSPFEFPSYAIPLPLLAAFAIAGWFSQHSVLRRWLTPARRRRLQVESDGRAAFVEHRVGETEKRTGILVYVSLLERDALVVADRAAVKRLSSERLEEFRAALARASGDRYPARRIGGELRAFGVYLGETMPWDSELNGPKRDELPNSPKSGERE